VCCGRLQSLRSRAGVVGVATRLGWPLACETRYREYNKLLQLIVFNLTIKIDNTLRLLYISLSNLLFILFK
jgi:hypothetical protein